MKGKVVRTIVIKKSERPSTPASKPVRIPVGQPVAIPKTTVVTK